MSGLLFNIFAVLPPWGSQSFSPSICLNAILDGKWCFLIPRSLDILPPKLTLQVLDCISAYSQKKKTGLGNKWQKMQQFGQTICFLPQQTHWKRGKDLRCQSPFERRWGKQEDKKAPFSPFPSCSHPGVSWAQAVYSDNGHKSRQSE